MRLKLISCDVFQREINAAVARSRNHVEVEFFSRSLHKLPEQRFVRRVQRVMDGVDPAAFQAVLLAWGTCRRTLTGLRARSIPLVLPRTQDCTMLVLCQHESFCGSPSAREPSLEKVSSPFRREPSRQVSLSPRDNHFVDLPRLQKKDSAHSGATWDWRAQFDHPRRSRASRWLRHACFPLQTARRRGLLQMLLDGYWSYDQFLAVPPGWRVVAREDKGIITAEELPT
jgi:hypothetical protein